MHNDIKAVVFDVGGVIRLNARVNPLEQIADMIGVSHIAFKEEYWKHNHLSNVNNISWEDMVVSVAKKFNDTDEAEQKIRTFVREHDSARTTNVDLLNIIPSLRKAGIKVGILSNATTELKKWLDDEGIAPLFDAVVISGEIGYQKPHKEAFQVLFERLGIKSQQVIFIDDSPKSLEKAGEIGYVPILFKSNAQLKEDLQKFGVL